jgi:hypothetical protein
MATLMARNETVETHVRNVNVSDNCDEKCSDMTVLEKCEGQISEPSVSVLKVSAATKKKRAHKYDDYHLKLGFLWTGNESEPIPLCVICYETLRNDNMKPSNHKHQNRHKDIQGLNKTMHIVTRVENMKVLEASHGVLYLIAKFRVIGETLIKPAAKVVFKVMAADKAVANVCLSNNTIHHRITDTAKNIKQQLLLRVRQSRYYALQADESTDIVNAATLLFVR